MTASNILAIPFFRFTIRFVLQLIGSSASLLYLHHLRKHGSEAILNTLSNLNLINATNCGQQFKTELQLDDNWKSLLERLKLLGPQYPIPVSPNLVSDKQAIFKLDPQVAEVVSEPNRATVSLSFACICLQFALCNRLGDAQRNFLDVLMRIPRVNCVRPERVIWNTKRKAGWLPYHRATC